MPFKAHDVLHRANIILQDTGATRWPMPELADWLDDAVTEISVHLPTAVSEEVTLPMSVGVEQSLPDTATSLLRVVCNIDEATGTRGASIRPIAREVLDTHMSGWQDPATMPFAKKVVHVVQDVMNPRTFLVVPGNDGSGAIRATVALSPTPVARPEAPNDLVAENYDADVSLPAIYRNAVVDYVLYRAFSKDAGLPGAPERAAAHYQQFASAIGLKRETDKVANVNTSGTN